jgi:CRP/FNR family cyclic AMP-dependent transcriptional regulator
MMNAGLRPPTDASITAGRPAFDMRALLQSSGVAATISEYDASDILFAQGDAADAVMHVQRGIIKKSVTSRNGKEAVVALIGTGDFLGEECLAGQPNRTATATAMTATSVLTVDKHHMLGLMHRHPALTDQFLTRALARLMRTEADLLDHLFNPTEKRLARTLLLLARDWKAVQRHGEVPMPQPSQEMLGEMVGTTRSRVNLFMNKFKRRGLIDYDGGGGLTINSALVSVIQQDDSRSTDKRASW